MENIIKIGDNRMIKKSDLAKIIKEDKHLYIEDKIELIKIIKEMSEEEFMLEQNVRTKQGASVIGFLKTSWNVGGAYKLARAAFDKCYSACGTFGINGPKRQICIAKCKVLMADSNVKNLQKGKAEPDKIRKAQQKLIDAKAYFKKMQSWALNHGRNPNPTIDVTKKNLFRAQ